ncbi:hypothetical protein Mapa_010418 [Marchantia paleacea]|nr:hypothetical protein Mapa_010418 [Marchantia paleacea]
MNVGQRAEGETRENPTSYLWKKVSSTIQKRRISKRQVRAPLAGCTSPKKNNGQAHLTVTIKYSPYNFHRSQKIQSTREIFSNP